jgi:hypothetical protein
MIGAPEPSLSRFRILAKTLHKRPTASGGCVLSIHSVTWNQPSSEAINVCALFGRDRLMAPPLSSAQKSDLKEKPKRPTFELAPD